MSPKMVGPRTHQLPCLVNKSAVAADNHTRTVTVYDPPNNNTEYRRVTLVHEKSERASTTTMSLN